MLKRVSPALRVADMRRALAFYEGSLGFRCAFKLEDELHPEIPYAIVERDEVEIHLQRKADAAGKSCCYVFLDGGIDAIYAEYQRTGVRFTRTIEDSSYGNRDFSIADVDGNELTFGALIAS
jgi:uncharacterized glyoxalase superfamily protein PhnB